MEFVTRAQWGARPPRGGRKHVTWSQRTHFSVHYTGGPRSQHVRTIQDWCMDGRGFLDIDYNWLVDYNGVIYEGRGWDYAGSHTLNLNTPHIGVAFIGYDQDVTDKAKHALVVLYNEANRLKGSALVKTWHGANAQTDCPGTNLRTWVRSGMRDPLPPPPPPKPTYPAWAGKILKRGMVNNTEVRKFQTKLHQRGWKITVDGDFGPGTEAIVKAFQREKKLTLTDGRVDKKTWDAIYTAPVTDS